jgi:CheY-like chemotaxis protein
MPAGGEVRIRVAAVSLDAHGRVPLRAGRYVRVSVADSGPGVPADHLGHIFDPFFSTKPHGSGLGLATAWSIVKKHDGHIQVTSPPGEGATFIVWLPASDRPLAPAAVSAAPPPASQAATAGRILVMDDEELVRGVVVRILERAGFDVAAVPDGDAALAAWRRAREDERPFVAGILDLTVPGGRGGDEIVGELLALDPGARVIVSSGYSTSPVVADFRRFGFRASVPKPYAADELVRAVREALAGPAAPSQADLP